MSPGELGCVFDTVVLRYFLLADAFELLVRLAGPTLGVTRIVYDPDEEADVASDLRSEITRSVAEQLTRAADAHRTDEERTQARQRADLLAAISDWHQQGAVTILDMDEPELELYGRLTDPDSVSELGLIFPLGPGEAASLAVAVNRRLTLATDDNDALKAMRTIRRRHSYERIRKLLIEAVNRSFITAEEANAIHRTMRQAGFWDRQAPFP